MSCYDCDQCRAGRPHTCRKLRFLGCPGEADGCLAEYVVMPERSLYPTHDRVSLEQAALCEPLSIGVYAVRQAGLRGGETIGILGSGPIGLCVLLAARAAGVDRAFMTDRIAERVDFARGLGAAWSGNPDRADVRQAILDQAPGGLDVVFECAGKQATLDQAVDLLKPGGKLMIIGIPHEPRVSFAIDPLRRNEITIVNVRRQNDCVQAALDLVSTGAVRVETLATHRFRPEQSQQGFELVSAYRDGVIKALIEF